MARQKDDRVGSVSFGSTPDEKAREIASRLMDDFGFTAGQASGIVGNLWHETSGFTTNQEKSPAVKGSRGGFGWGQWTGPRRNDFESYCAALNLDPASDEANYRYLSYDLKNNYPEAIASVKLTYTPQEAANAFLHDYEGTPSKTAHADRRIAAANQVFSSIINPTVGQYPQAEAVGINPAIAQGPIDVALASLETDPRQIFAAADIPDKPPVDTAAAISDIFGPEGAPLGSRQRVADDLPGYHTSTGIVSNMPPRPEAVSTGFPAAAAPRPRVADDLPGYHTSTGIVSDMPPRPDVLSTGFPAAAPTPSPQAQALSYPDMAREMQMQRAHLETPQGREFNLQSHKAGAEAEQALRNESKIPAFRPPTPPTPSTAYPTPETTLEKNRAAALSGLPQHLSIDPATVSASTINAPTPSAEAQAALPISAAVKAGEASVGQAPSPEASANRDMLPRIDLTGSATAANPPGLGSVAEALRAIPSNGAISDAEATMASSSPVTADARPLPLSVGLTGSAETPAGQTNTADAGTLRQSYFPGKAADDALTFRPSDMQATTGSPTPSVEAQKALPISAEVKAAEARSDPAPTPTEVDALREIAPQLGLTGSAVALSPPVNADATAPLPSNAAIADAEAVAQQASASSEASAPLPLPGSPSSSGLPMPVSTFNNSPTPTAPSPAPGSNVGAFVQSLVDAFSSPAEAAPSPIPSQAATGLVGSNTISPMPSESAQGMVSPSIQGATPTPVATTSLPYSSGGSDQTFDPNEATGTILTGEKPSLNPTGVGQSPHFTSTPIGLGVSPPAPTPAAPAPAPSPPSDLTPFSAPAPAPTPSPSVLDTMSGTDTHVGKMEDDLGVGEAPYVPPAPTPAPLPQIVQQTAPPPVTAPAKPVPAPVSKPAPEEASTGVWGTISNTAQAAADAVMKKAEEAKQSVIHTFLSSDPIKRATIGGPVGSAGFWGNLDQSAPTTTARASFLAGEKARAGSGLYPTPLQAAQALVESMSRMGGGGMYGGGYSGGYGGGYTGGTYGGFGGSSITEGTGGAFKNR